MRGKIMSVGITVLCVLIAVSLGFSLFLFVNRENRQVLKATLKNGETIVSFEALALVPGEAEEYTLRLTSEMEGDCTLTWHFQEDSSEANDLKEYVRVKVRQGEDILFDKWLCEVLEEEPFSMTCCLDTKEKTEFYITYYMPETVGNEATRTEAKFDLLLTAKNA